MITTDPPLAPMCGTADFTVCHTPVRLMSSVFRHVSSVSSHVGAPAVCIPALATMTSSRPDSPTAASIAVAHRLGVAHVGHRGHASPTC